jgi:hypothetical protein
MTRQGVPRDKPGKRLFHLGIAITVILAFAGGAELAHGSDDTRSGFVKQAEPICKGTTVANRTILRGIRSDIRKGRLKRAGRKFQRAERELESTIDDLELLERPEEDDSTLVRWFRQLNAEANVLGRIAGRLKADDTTHLRRYILELLRTANKANNIVLTFGFDHCLLRPAQYF